MEFRNLERIIVEHRRRLPVAVETHKRKRQITLHTLIFRYELDKTFNVHTVFKGIIQIFFFFRRKSEFNLNFNRPARVDAYSIVFTYFFAVNRPFCGNTVEIFCLFRNGETVRRKLFGHKYSLRSEIKFFCAEFVFNIERYVIYTVLCRVVAEFELRSAVLDIETVFMHSAYRILGFGFNGIKVCFRREYVVQSRKSCALFSRRTSQTFLVVNRDCCTHYDLIYTLVEKLSIPIGVFFFKLTAKKRRKSREVGRSHRRTAHFVVTARNSRRYFSAVRGYLGFYF